MAAQASPSEDNPRRSFGRMKLGIPATLETIHGRKHVRMVDLSQGGALVLLPQEIPVRDCMVNWLGFEAFASAVWRHGTQVGLAFEEPLALAKLMATRNLAPELIQQENLAAEDAARGWSEGWFSAGSER